MSGPNEKLVAFWAEVSDMALDRRAILVDAYVAARSRKLEPEAAIDEARAVAEPLWARLPQPN